MRNELCRKTLNSFLKPPLLQFLTGVKVKRFCSLSRPEVSPSQMQQWWLRAVGPFPWLTEQETIGHDIILPGRSASCLTFFTQETHTTHTFDRKWPLSTRKEITNMDAGTQELTHT